MNSPLELYYLQKLVFGYESTYMSLNIILRYYIQRANM